MASMVDVIAPSDMPPGYSFNATYNGVTLPVIVPEGGVRAGETMKVPFNANGSNGFVTGRWKDDVFSCCSLGFCHPHWWFAWCCTPCAIAQVMTRMRLNWCGKPASEESSWRSTYRTVLMITIAVGVLRFILAFTSTILYPPDDSGNQTGNPVSAASDIAGFLFLIYVLVIIIRTRGHVRERYAIQGDCCSDCCCSFWCRWCVVAQMARQTHDYVAQPVECCSSGCCSSTGTSV